MINKTKWLNTLPKLNNNIEDETLQLDHEKWVSTISKKQHHNSFTKYSLIIYSFIPSLLPYIKYNKELYDFNFCNSKLLTII